MGADLYIRSLYDEQTKVWQPLFDEAVRRRDKLPTGTPEYEEAQKRVGQCFENMNDVGYFRDPYNGWDMLWRYGLSWWTDIIPLLDKDHRLSVANVEHVLALLDEHEDEFEDNMSECPPEEREYFETQAKSLRDFLNQAIELDEPIACIL